MAWIPNCHRMVRVPGIAGIGARPIFRFTLNFLSGNDF